MSTEAYRVVGYIRVSTSEQADSGAGLEAQRASIEAEAECRGWQLVHVYEDAGLLSTWASIPPRPRER
jgi:DNA invertase Pin-like site-specific DNA recombinase